MPQPRRASRAKASQLEVWPGSAYPLGAKFDGAGTNCAVFSEVAQAVVLGCQLVKLHAITSVRKASSSME